MLKVGDRVKYKYGYGYDNCGCGEVIEINIRHHADSTYKIESKIGDGFIRNIVAVYRTRKELYKIIMICAGVF